MVLEMGDFSHLARPFTKERRKEEEKKKKKKEGRRVEEEKQGMESRFGFDID